MGGRVLLRDKGSFLSRIELAKAIGVDPDAMKWWIKKGFVKVATVQQNGARLFVMPQDRDLRVLAVTQALITCGLAHDKAFLIARADPASAEKMCAEMRALIDRAGGLVG
ncbi:hypothetical protein [Azospirillum thiophilum]|uniref:hypothetical protein n=1 Tax=Azospirillum thiophilum TaxID=528244 RepID=UPI00118753E9|nr:hypothetical protein [Azospirillum thiophilum]